MKVMVRMGVSHGFHILLRVRSNLRSYCPDGASSDIPPDERLRIAGRVLKTPAVILDLAFALAVALALAAAITVKNVFIHSTDVVGITVFYLFSSEFMDCDVLSVEAVA